MSTRNQTTVDLTLPLATKPRPARRPPEEMGIARDEVKMLVLDRATGSWEHQIFLDLPTCLREGDVVVVNTSRTLPVSLPATLDGRKEELRVHVAAKLSDTSYIVERRTKDPVQDHRAFCTGDGITIDHDGHCFAKLRVLGRFHPNSRFWYIESDHNLWNVAKRIGQPIRYGYLQSRPDVDAFQTMFAVNEGSAEMPSAGRPFTERVLVALRNRGVIVVPITLHTGVSSHEVENSLESHPFLPEWYSVPEETARIINEVLSRGRRVIAVGTTVVRTLESAATDDGFVVPSSGWTTIVISPGNQPRIVTGLLTGLHDADTSHLAMLYAFVSRDKLLMAYSAAATSGYLWHEFGDVNLIL